LLARALERLVGRGSQTFLAFALIARPMGERERDPRMDPVALFLRLALSSASTNSEGTFSPRKPTASSHHHGIILALRLAAGLPIVR
jgi:hypothetical protein